MAKSTKLNQMKNDFYTSLNKKLPKINNRTLRLFLISFSVLLSLILLIARFDDPFNLHLFKSETIREFNGVYFNQPKPMIILDQGNYPEGFRPEALLIGNGKFGAEAILAEKETIPSELNGKRIRLRGTLLSGDGKLLIELTDGAASILSLDKSISYPVQQTRPEPALLKGVILDPKCWFGGTKPLEGMVNKSCAIQGISGGTPPLFRVEKDGQNIYYVLESTSVEQINKVVLEFVAEAVLISGQVLSQNGWNVLRTSAEQIIYLNKK